MWRPLIDRLARTPFPLWMGAWSLLLTLMLTWPAPMALSEEALGSPHADGLKHLWTLWWIRQEVLVDGSFPFATDYINYPMGMDLYPIEPLNGLLAVMMGRLPVIAVANLIAIINLSLTGLFGGLLGRRLGGRDIAGFASGTLLQGSAISIFTVHVGVGELQHLWWLPLGLWAWFRLRESMRVRDALLLAGAMAGATISCFYHGFFLATAVATLSTVTLWAGPRTPRLLGRYVIAAGLGLALVVPIVSSFSASYVSSDIPDVGVLNYMTTDWGQPLTDPPSARLDPVQLVLPRGGERATASAQLLAYGGGRYLGVFALLLALGALIREPRRTLPWLAAGAVGVLLACGSYLVQAGETVVLAGNARVQLPFLYLNRALGYIGEPLNFPVRFLSITATAVAASAALLARRHPRAAAVLAILAVLDVQLNQLIPRPLPTLAPWSYPELVGIDPPGTEPTVDLALAWRADSEVRFASLSAQMHHGQRIQGVPIERVEFFARDARRYVRALPMVETLEPAWGHQDVDVDPATLRPDFALLRDIGFTRILIAGTGSERRLPPQTRTTFKKFFGPPLAESDNVILYAIPEVTFTEAELQGWKAEQEQRVAALARQKDVMGEQLN